MKKCQCGDYVKYKICSLGQSSNTTSRPILSKKKQGENVQFLTKIVGFKKIHHGDHIKSIFFSLGKLVLQPDDHQTLFLGLYCPNTNKQEISNFFDQNDWLFLYWSSNIISRLFCQKNKMRWNFQTLTKIMG